MKLFLSSPVKIHSEKASISICDKFFFACKNSLRKSFDMWAASKCFWKALSFSLQRPWSNLSLRYILEVIIFLIQFGPWKFSLLIEVPLNHQASLCIQLYSNEFKSLVINVWFQSKTLDYIDLYQFISTTTVLFF